MVPLKLKDEGKKPRDSKSTQTDMNIILLTFDSQSRANIQRQWTNSYKYLENDPDSVIMKVKFLLHLNYCFFTYLNCISYFFYLSVTDISTWGSCLGLVVPKSLTSRCL